VAVPRVPTFGVEVVPSSKLSALADAASYAINPTGCGVALVAAQNVTSGSVPLITFDIEDFDSASQFTAPGTTITVAEPGFYQLSCYVAWPSNAAGYRLAQIEVNGSTIAQDAKPAANGIGTGCSAGIGKLLAAGDGIAVRVTQNSGSTLGITGRLSIIRGTGT